MDWYIKNQHGQWMCKGTWYRNKRWAYRSKAAAERALHRYCQLYPFYMLGAEVTSAEW